MIFSTLRYGVKVECNSKSLVVAEVAVVFRTVTELLLLLLVFPRCSVNCFILLSFSSEEDIPFVSLLPLFAVVIELFVVCVLVALLQDSYWT